MFSTPPASPVIAIFVIVQFCAAIGYGQTVEQKPSHSTKDRLARDLEFVPENAFAIAVLHSADLLELAGNEFVPFARTLPMPFEHSDVESLTAFAAPGIDRWQSFNYGLVFRFNKDISAEALARVFVPGSVAQKTPDFEYFGPQSYERTANSPPIFFLLVTNPRTAILCTEPNTLFSLFADAKAGNGIESEEKLPWEPLQAQMLARQLTGEAILSVDFARLSNYQFSSNLLFLTRFGDDDEFEFPADPNQFDAAFVSLNFRRKEALQVAWVNPKNETRELAITPTSVPAAHLRGRFDYLREQSPQSASSTIESIYQQIRDLFGDVVAKETGNDVIWESTSFPNAGQTLELLGKILQANKTMATHQVKLLSSSRNFVQMGLALLNYESRYRRFPGDILSDDGKPLLSWRVAVLPYLENHELYNSFHLDEPWDSEHNKTLIAKMPDVFLTRESDPVSNKTRIQMPVGKGTVASSSGVGFKGITDGGANTIALVEAKEAVTWSQPGDFNYEDWLPSEPGTYRLCIMCDGSRLRIPSDYSAEKLAAAVRYKDGKPAADLSEPPSRSVVRGRPENKTTEEEVLSLLEKADWRTESGVKNLICLARAASELPRRSAAKIVGKFASGLEEPDPLKRQLALLGIYSSCRGVDLPTQRIVSVATTDRFERNRWLAIQLLLQQFDKAALQQLASTDLGQTELEKLLLQSERDAERIVPFLADTFLPLLQSEDKHTLAFALAMVREFGLSRHSSAVRKLLKRKDAELTGYVQYLLDARLGDGPLVKALEKNGGDLGAAVEELAENARVEGDAVYSVVFEEYSYRQNYEGNLNLNDFKQLATQPLVSISLTESKIDDEGLALLTSIKTLKRLKLVSCEFISPEGFQVLEQSPSLEYLEVNSANFNDLGAKAISKLENLEDLNLSGTDLGDEGLAALAGLRKLQRLNVNRTLVTDEGLAHFKGHSTLEVIELFNTGVTDKSIDTILSLKKLRDANIYSTGITEAGAKRLQKAK